MKGNRPGPAGPEPVEVVELAAVVIVVLVISWNGRNTVDVKVVEGKVVGMVVVVRVCGIKVGD